MASICADVVEINLLFFAKSRELAGVKDGHLVVSWEQRNSCMLPEDLKRFYLTSDGLLLKWSVKLDGKFNIPVCTF